MVLAKKKEKFAPSEMFLSFFYNKQKKIKKSKRASASVNYGEQKIGVHDREPPARIRIDAKNKPLWGQTYVSALR